MISTITGAMAGSTAKPVTGQMLLMEANLPVRAAALISARRCSSAARCALSASRTFSVTFFSAAISALRWLPHPTKQRDRTSVARMVETGGTVRIAYSLFFKNDGDGVKWPNTDQRSILRVLRWCSIRRLRALSRQYQHKRLANKSANLFNDNINVW